MITLPEGGTSHHLEPVLRGAGPLTEMVLLGNLAIRTGKKVVWDSEKLEVTNVSEANRYIARDYRKGWTL